MDTLVAFRFVVTVGNVIFGFSKISGITKDVEVEQYQEGGCNDYVHLFVKPVSSAKTLSLEKGVLQFGISPFYLVGEPIDSLTIEVLNRLGILVKRYLFRNLIVTKWDVQELNASTNGILIDHFELQYEEFTIVDLYSQAKSAIFK